MNIQKAFERVLEGETVKCRPKGNSMIGLINSGQLVTIEPITDETILSKGDIVLCKVKGHYYIHLVNAIGKDERYQIANNRGRINGWTKKVVGIVTKIEA